MSNNVREATIEARNYDLAAMKDELANNGYVLVEHNGGQHNAIEILQQLGKLIPQYHGALEHEVTYRPGFDDKAYSQSNNTILAHTEAPGWSPSPRFLALYCHRQAQCGGGHTDILDLRELLPLLNKDEKVLLESTPLHFPGPGGGVTRNIVELEKSGSVLRFSFNLLTSGEYDPPLDNIVSHHLLPMGKMGFDLAHKINNIFIENCSSVLIPDDALLIWDNQRLLHARSKYEDKNRRLVRYWIA